MSSNIKLKYTLNKDNLNSNTYSWVKDLLINDVQDLLLKNDLDSIYKIVQYNTKKRPEDSVPQLTEVLCSLGIDIFDYLDYVPDFCFNLTHVLNVDLPHGIKSIGERAFQTCDISKITIPGSCSTIGSYAFCGCKQLREINMEEGVDAIADGVFFVVKNAKIKMPDSITNINNRAFSSNPKQNNIVICKSSNTYVQDFCNQRNITLEIIE